MPDTIIFDTLTYAKRLKAVGFTEEQAEVQTQILAQIVDEKLATKKDILELKRDMKEMELRLKHDLTLRLGAILTAGIAIVAALVKLL